MTIFEVFFLLVDLAIGIVIAGWAFHEFGWIGGVVGLITGVAFIPALIWFVPELRRRWQRRKGML